MGSALGVQSGHQGGLLGSGDEIFTKLPREIKGPIFFHLTFKVLSLQFEGLYDK